MRTRLALLLVSLPWIAVHRSASTVISADKSKAWHEKTLLGDWSSCISTVHRLKVKDNNSVAAAYAFRPVVANIWRRVYVSEWAQLQDKIAEWHSTRSTAGGLQVIWQGSSKVQLNSTLLVSGCNIHIQGNRTVLKCPASGSAVVIDRLVSRRGPTWSGNHAVAAAI